MNPSLLDTDTLSAIMKAKHRHVIKQSVAYLNRHGQFTFSIITLFEVRRGLLAIRATRRLRTFEALCQHSTILGLSNAIVLRASELYADLYQRGQLIGDADVLIAATALQHGMSLVTANTGHFQRIAGLTLEDWTKP